MLLIKNIYSPLTALSLFVICTFLSPTAISKKYRIINQKDFDRVKTKTFQPGDRILFKRGETFEGQFAPSGSGRKDWIPRSLSKVVNHSTHGSKTICLSSKVAAAMSPDLTGGKIRSSTTTCITGLTPRGRRKRRYRQSDLSGSQKNSEACSTEATNAAPRFPASPGLRRHQPGKTNSGQRRPEFLGTSPARRLPGHRGI